MELFFSDCAASRAAEYFLETFPGRTAVLYSSESTRNLFLRAGVRLSEASEEQAQAVAVGADCADNYRRARLTGTEYILSGGVDFTEMISDFSIIGFQKLEKGYPKAAFIDIADSERFRQQEEIFSTYAYLDILDKGLVDGFKKEVKESVTQALEELKEGSPQERLKFFTEALTASGGRSEFFGMRRALSSVTGRSFALVALFTAIRFTNFDFGSILLGRSDAEARLRGEICSRAAAPRRTPNLYLMRKYLPSENEFREWSGAIFQSEECDPREELTLYQAAAALTAGEGFFPSVWDAGFIDGMLRGEDYLTGENSLKS